MAIVLQGDPYNLQGSSGAGLQQAGNLQQVYGPVPPVTPAPTVTPAKPIGGQSGGNRTYYPQQSSQAKAQPIQLDPLYAQFVGTRASTVNPGVLEYFNTESGQGFSNERDVLNYILTRTGRNLSSLGELNAAPVGSQGIGSSSPGAVTDPNQALARAAAQAGLSVDDYLKLTSGQYAVTPEERAKINQDLGIPGLESTLFTPPSKTTQQIYQDAFNQAGLADLKVKIAELDGRVAAIRQKYTDKQGTINENPFLSEASRTGRMKILNDQGNAEIGNLLSEQQQYVDLYNSGINEVNNLVTRVTSDFNSTQTFNAQKLQYLQTKAEEQLQDLQAKKSSQAYTYLPDYLQAKAKAQKPDTIGSDSTGYFKWNPDTGAFEQIIAPKAKVSSGGGGGSYGGGSLSAEAKAVLNGTLKLEDLTPTVRGRIAGELLQAGYNRTENLNAGQREQIDLLDTVLREAQSAQTILDGGINTGQIASRIAAGKAVLGGAQEFTQYRSIVSNLSSILLRARSGAAVTPQEYDRIKGFIPLVNDDEKTAKTKIARFMEEMAKARQNYITRATQTSRQIAGSQPGVPLVGGVDLSDLSFSF